VYHRWRSLDAELLAEASAPGFTVSRHHRQASRRPVTAPDLAILAVDDNRLSSLQAALPDIAKVTRSLAPGDHALVATNP